VHILRSLGQAYQITAPSGSASAAQAILQGVYAISVYARNSDIRIDVEIGAATAAASATTATKTSHYVGLGERIDIILPAGNGPCSVSAYGVSGAGVLEVSELM
jgi:hypothetical protein